MRQTSGRACRALDWDRPRLEQISEACRRRTGGLLLLLSLLLLSALSPAATRPLNTRRRQAADTQTGSGPQIGPQPARGKRLESVPRLETRAGRLNGHG